MLKSVAEGGAGVDWERRFSAWRADAFEVLGSSRLGRPVLGRTFGAGAVGTALGPARPGPTLVVVGATHGDEPSSAEAVWELGQRLAVTDHQGAQVAVLLIPALNPDGLVAGTKNAASDVDLNRNFPARNFERAHVPGYDPGPFPLSEPETALLARVLDERGAVAVVSVHAPFACVNFDGPAAGWAEAVASACGWPARADIGYPTPGSLGSWLGLDRDMPLLTLELPPGELEGFRSQAACALDAAVAWAQGHLGAGAGWPPTGRPGGANVDGAR